MAPLGFGDYIRAAFRVPYNLILFAGGIVAGGDSAVRIRATLDAIKAALSPHEVGYYPNFVEHPVDASAFFDPVTWARLRRVKALYDPQDVFKGNHHVPPAS